MNTKDAAKGAATFVGPLVLAAGTASLTVALVGSQPGQSSGTVAGPRPTVTVTATAAEATPAPSPSPSGTSRTDRTGQAVAVQPAARRRTASGGTGGGGSGSGSGGTVPASRPRPTKTSTPPSTGTSGCQTARVAAVQLPLGALPCDTVRVGRAITIGGTR